MSHDNKPKDKEPTLEELRALVKSQDEALKRANRERDEAEATLRASRSRPAPTASGEVVKGRTEPVVLEDIASTDVRQLVKDATELAPQWVDSAERRAKFAGEAQDHLIALRLLGCAFSHAGVSLSEGGDLYVGSTGAHPRHVAPLLAAAFSTGALADLVEGLKARLEYEAA